jgi:hypothetical protein
LTYLPWGTYRQPGTGWWRWALWLDRKRVGPRPNVTWRVPLWAWPRYLLHRGKPQPSPPPVQTPPSIFTGRWLFTAHDPTAAARLRGKVTGVFLKVDGDDAAMPWDANELRKLGFRIGTWEAENRFGQGAVNHFGSEVHVFQDEGPGQRESAVRWLPDMRVPCALVTNNWSDTFPPHFYCYAESYLVVNGNATPERVVADAWMRGAREISPCFGISEYGRRVSLAEYRALWTQDNFAIYLAEQLDDFDLEAL